MWEYLLILALLYAIYRYRLLFKGCENVENQFPGKSCLPFIGNIHHFYGDTHKIYRCLEEQCVLFRRSFYVWTGPFLFICLTKPTEIEALLNNTVNIKKSKIYEFLLPWIKRGLLTSYGDKWKKNRKILTPAFHFGILEGFLEIFNQNGNTFCKIMENNVGIPKFDVMDFVKMYAMDNICETAMGVTVNAQENPTSDYVQSTKKMCMIAFHRTLKVWLRPDFIFNMTALGKEQRKSLEILHDYTNSVIDRRIEQRRQTKPDEPNTDEFGLKKKRAFLDLLLDNYDEGQLTIGEVQEEVDTFMFEGHDTITSALSFAIYALGDHQDIQTRAYEEQCEIFGDDTRNPSMDDINKMKYLEMIVKEALRLYPSVPVFGRYIEKDWKLDEYSTVPAGAEVVILTPGVHRNPDVWKDPYVFDPERFTAENIGKRHPYSYIPFSAGPRNCIGMRFAMTEMKSFLSKVLRKFQINPCEPKTELKLATEVTLQSATGVPISVALRQS